MPTSVVSGAFAAVVVFMAVAAGHAPALCQDFSITNPVEPPDTGRRDLMKQLQAWWDTHGFYPRHASQMGEAGTVKVVLVIRTDGNIWKVDVSESSGSNTLDAAALSAFRGGFVRPFPAGEQEARVDVALHYNLSSQQPRPRPPEYVPVASRRGFTITNDPVRSPILETMLQKTCTGTVVKEGIRNHSMYGGRHWAQAIFFRKPDGTPWVKFNEGGEPLMAPVTEIGKLVQWTGRVERPRKNVEFYYRYTVWPDGDNSLDGSIEAYFYFGLSGGTNTGGTVDFKCATETVPQIAWDPLSVNVYQAPSIDPP